MSRFLCTSVKKKSKAADMFSDSSSTSSDASSSRYIPGYIPVPMSDANSENSDPASTMTDPEQSKMYQAYKGQLKLSVYVNYGLLTVHVMMGRHYKPKWMTSCDSYVKLSLLPDETKRTRCKTEIIHETNSPLYDEKFSFELLDEDRNKRLYISVWHRDNMRHQCEFLGCMSFGMTHIQKRPVTGWYYLLTGDVGHKKHLAVNEKKVGLSDRSNKNIPTVNQDVMWMEPHMLVVKKPSKGGFGFSINGSCPVQVCKVESGSPANQSGLSKEDCIIRIDGLNVSRSTSESVARIIRHAKRQIVLEIQRPKRIKSYNSSAKSAPLPETPPKKPLCSSTPANQPPITIGEMAVSPWRGPRRGGRKLEPERPASAKPPPAPAKPGGSLFETHDYGWLDIREQGTAAADGPRHDAPADISSDISDHTYQPMTGSMFVNQTDTQKETFIGSEWDQSGGMSDSDYVHPYPPGQHDPYPPSEHGQHNPYPRSEHGHHNAYPAAQQGQHNPYLPAQQGQHKPYPPAKQDHHYMDDYSNSHFQSDQYSVEYEEDYRSGYNHGAVDSGQFYNLTHISSESDYGAHPPPPPSRHAHNRQGYQVDNRLHDIQESELDNSHIYEALDIADMNPVHPSYPRKPPSFRSGSSMKSGSSGYSSATLPKSLKLGRPSSKYQNYGWVDGGRRDARTGTGHVHVGWTGSLPRSKKVSFTEI